MDKRNESDDLYAVAIVGMAGRFPGADSIAQFWQNLRDGIESITPFEDEELLASGVDPALLLRPDYVKAGALLEGVDLFDARFFGFSPREAETLDPQHRIFLECAWEAMENAGYNCQSERGSVGVFAGANTNYYFLSNIYPNLGALESGDNFLIEIANEKDHLTTRTSYKLNLRGPSIAVQTACSTSLVAIHLACQSLLHYECDLALAGGSSINNFRKEGYFYNEGGVASPDGHCRAFDARAQGTVSGSGVGIVVLKRLSEALADGDTIDAVIRGSAINNDGSLKVGYTAPSVEGQARVIKEALDMSGVHAESISYIELHGTGTMIGDPIEFKALTKAYSAYTDRKGFCALGSVKTNVGHLNSAAGVTGLIKAVLALKHEQIPPSLHFESPNPEIDFAGSPFYVNSKLNAWETGGAPRRAGVSSFGIGGTNAHLIVEQAPAPEPPSQSRDYQLLALSAKTQAALSAKSANLADHLKQHSSICLADLAYTLQVGRVAFEHRRMFVCGSADEAIAALESPPSEQAYGVVKEVEDRQVVFMLPGQGSQYVNMLRGLYEAEPGFREQVSFCAEILKPSIQHDLVALLYPDAGGEEDASQKLNQTCITQPALFVTEYALAKLWMQWGIKPRAMIGHSVGEYVAACLAGVLSLEDALMLVAARGRLMQELPEGAMLSVPLSEAELRQIIGEEISIAAVNAPSLCAVSGSKTAIEAFERQLASQGIECRRLNTSRAFHSKMEGPVIERFAEELRQVSLNAPKIPYISNLTGTWITESEARDAGYWIRHMRQSVRFSEGVAELFKEPGRVFLEVGPGQTLTALAKTHSDKASRHTFVSSSKRANDQSPDLRFLLNALGKLWLAGVEIDWPLLCANEKRRRIPLPTYPFERQRYWIEPHNQAATGQTSLDKRPDVADWFYIPLWKQSITPSMFAARKVEKARWLVFADRCNLGGQLARRLERDGHEVILVEEAENFNRFNRHAYSMNPLELEGYERLFTELRAADGVPDFIIHLWSITGEQGRESLIGEPLIEAHNDAQSRGFYSLLSIAQALGNLDVTKTIQLFVLSNNMQRVTGEDYLCPQQATVLGPCKVIPKEYPNIACRSIDIVLAAPSSPAEERLIDSLLAEFGENSADQVVAYRDRQRWVQGFEPVRLEALDEHASLLRERGVYLITGGLSGIGLEMADFLSRSLQARLVLVGEASLPDESEWGSASEGRDGIGSRIEKLSALKERGFEVMTFTVNVADREQMKDVIDRACERFGAINGVIHAVTSPGAGLIQLKTVEMAEKVLAPVAQGAQIVRSLLAGASLDFFAFFSSTTSIIPGLGQVDSCAANAFLDALATGISLEQGIHAVSIDWSLWHSDTSQEALVASVPEMQLQMRQARESYGIKADEGIEAVCRVLSCNVPQVVVCTQDFKAVTELQNALTARSLLDDLGAIQKAKQKYPRPDAGGAFIAPRNEIEQTVAETWQELFNIESISVHDDFFELGGHSLLALQLVSRLRTAFQVEMQLSSIFETPTVAGLAGTIAEKRMGVDEIDEINSLLEAIEGMTPDQVQERIERELRGSRESETNR